MFAIPNYIVFMILLSGICAFTEWHVHARRLRRILLTAILTWIVLEVLRWFLAIGWYDPTVPFLTWQLILVLSLSLSVASGIVMTTARLVKH